MPNISVKWIGLGGMDPYLRVTLVSTGRAMVNKLRAASPF